jgi:hypothetical protein
MTLAELDEVGFRWTKPTWERAADASWVLIVPSTMLKDAECGRRTDPQLDGCQRLYEIYTFDGSWFDQLHEGQVERLLRNPGWRAELRPTRKAA